MPAREDCPFCGSPRTDAEFEVPGEYDGPLVVECKDCGAKGPTGDGSEQDAWREWNKRVIEGVSKP